MSVDVVTKIVGKNESPSISISVVTPVDRIEAVRDAVSVSLERISNAVVDQQKLLLDGPAPPNGKVITATSDGVVVTESDTGPIGDIPFDPDQESAVKEEELASVES